MKIRFWTIVMGDVKKAKSFLTKAIKDSKEVSQAYNMLFRGEEMAHALNDLHGQMDLLKQAISLRGDDFFLLRKLGICTSMMSNDEKAINLFDKALELNPQDYNSLLSKGISLSKLGNDTEAVKLFDEALKLKHDNHIFFRARGISLSKMGYYQESLDNFERALNLNPQDPNSIRGKGISLSKMGKETDALKLFDEALKLKPKDYNTINSKAITLSKIGENEKAIEVLTEALELDSKNYKINTSLAILYFRNNQVYQAKKNIDRAYEHIPDNKHTRNLRTYIYSYLKGKDNSQPSTAISIDDVGKVKGCVEAVRESLEEDIDSFLSIMDETEKKRSEFLLNKSHLNQEMSFLLILRKWNSFTPIIPADQSERYVGGGYFIFHKGKGTVVDPGYHFIENFYRAGCRITDIDNIVMTHAHNDHTNDFESILSLLYQYNHKNKSDKQINIFLNTGSFMKFSGFLDLRNSDYIKKIVVLSAGDSYVLNEGISLKALPAYHDELISKEYSIGLQFSFLGETNKMNKTVVITSDTGLYPQKKSKKNNETVADTEGDEIWTKYDLPDEVNLLIAHIGSIKENEFKAQIDTENEEIFYPNHLGIMGVCRVVSSVRPNLAVVSEFGEELRDFQEKLIELIEKTTAILIDDDKTKVLPGDIPFIYDIFDETLCCVIKKEMIPIKDITYSVPDEKKDYTFYYWDKNLTKRETSKMNAETQTFKKLIEDRTGLYFKNQ